MFKLPVALTWFDLSTTEWPELEPNGLQRLPLSVICSARFRSLRQLSQSNLCSYLDVVRRKPERLLVLTEAYHSNFANLATPVTDIEWLGERFLECLKALDYLGDHQIIQACLSPKNIMLNFQGVAKISGFGLYYATLWGAAVDFPVIDPIYSAPEVFLMYFCNNHSISFSNPSACPLTILCDMWSLGLIFFELLFGRTKANPLHRHGSPNGCPREFRVINPFRNAQVLLEGLRLSKFRCCSLPEFLNVVTATSTDERFNAVENQCRKCLNFDPSQRLYPAFCLTALSGTFRNPESIGNQCLSNFPSLQVTSISAFPPVFPNETSRPLSKATEFLSNVSDVSELYHYWCLTGGNLDTVLRDSAPLSCDSRSNDPATNGKIPRADSPPELLSDPPIFRLPHYLAVRRSSSGDAHPLTEHRPESYDLKSSSYNTNLIFLPSNRLVERLSRIALSSLYPLLISPYLKCGFTKSDGATLNIENRLVVPLGNHGLPEFLSHQSSCSVYGLSTNALTDPRELQPIALKEVDVDYQIGRIRLFKRLLTGLPVTESWLRLESRKDIPSFLRKQIWTALLGVHMDHEYRERYAKALCALGEKALCFPGTFSCEGSARGNDYVDLKVFNQIAVDLPRCHAYDSLLASPAGQASLFQVLVTTVASKTDRLEYTQGMDSVAAVFVRLCYPDDALASACLRAFLLSKLSSFFRSGGFTVGLKAFFNVLVRLFAFHQPKLAVYLTDLNVPLVGLTTGWIYTFFAHTMPLDRTEVIWDTLIVGPLSLVMFFYLAVFIQIDQQVNLQLIGLEKICTILSNFPDIDLDKCRLDALRFALATPVSLTVGHGLFLCPKSSSTRTEGSPLATSLGNITESASSKSVRSFYERLCTPGAWPDHLEASNLSYTVQPHDLSPSDSCNLPFEDIPLVPWLHPEDAVEHLNRPDCFILDVRRTPDFNRSCISGSVHRPSTQLPPMYVEADSEESSELPTAASANDSDWEFIDCQMGKKCSLQVVHPFIASLSAEQAWISAVRARREALAQQSINKSSTSINSPGLFVVVGGSETSSEHLSNSPALHLANWLIRQDVDRVCVLSGGFPALLNVPRGSDCIVCPAAR